MEMTGGDYATVINNSLHHQEQQQQQQRAKRLTAVPSTGSRCLPVGRIVKRSVCVGVCGFDAR